MSRGMGLDSVARVCFNGGMTNTNSTLYVVAAAPEFREPLQLVIDAIGGIGFDPRTAATCLAALLSIDTVPAWEVANAIQAGASVKVV